MTTDLAVEDVEYAQEHFWGPGGPGPSPLAGAPQNRPTAEAEGRVTPRPAGVFWAHTGGRTEGWLCEQPAHDVYVRRVRRPQRGARTPSSEGQWASLWIYACAVCWPPKEGQG